MYPCVHLNICECWFPRGPEESDSVHGAQVIGACELPVRGPGN